MKKGLLITLIVLPLCAQIIQQEFLSPSKVRKPYKPKDFKTILYSDDEVFKTDSSQMSKEFIEVSGYRVQLIATQDLSEAIRVKARVDSLYSMPVYVDFEPPNYKVRIGNYETNEEAMSVQDDMMKQGFKYAWVVPSKIVVIK